MTGASGPTLMWYQLFMTSAIPGTRKKRGRPSVGSTQVQVRVPPDLLEPLDAAAKELSEASRPETIRRILRDWLIGHGHLKE